MIVFQTRWRIGFADDESVVHIVSQAVRADLVGPLEVTYAPTVGDVAAAMFGARRKRFGHRVGYQDRCTTGSCVHRRGFDRGPKVALGGHVVDRVMDQDDVEQAPEPQGPHVAGDVLALGIECRAQLQHLRRKITQGAREAPFQM